MTTTQMPNQNTPGQNTPDQQNTLQRLRTLVSSPLAIGIFYGLSTTFMLVVMNLCAKLMSQANFHPAELVTIRNGFCIFIIGGIALFQSYRSGVNLFKTDRFSKHMFRSFMGTMSVIFIFAAYSYLPLTTGTVLIFTSSLLTPILSVIFLREHVGPYRWVAVAVGFIGVIIASGLVSEMLFTHNNADQDIFESLQIIGIICALIGAIANASTQVTLRSLAGSEAPVTTAFYFMVFGCLFTAPFTIIFGGISTGQAHITSDLVWPFIGLIAMAVCSQISKSLMYQRIPASLAAIFPYTSLVWAALFDLTIFGIIPPSYVWIGGGIIIASNLFIFAREQKHAQKHG